MAKGSAFERLRMRLNREEGLKNLDQVVMDYGYVDGEPFTFVDHEFQIEIIRDVSQRIGVRKCSQVGLSEVMVQKTLGLAAIIPNIRIIFTLPTREMAMAFSKDRFDGAIAQSEHYKSLMSPGSNGATQKKIGDSMLYVGGTFGSTGAISIPAEFIISDEVDFSNAAVLGKLNSRIRHAKATDAAGNRGYRYRFSTPTFDGYGIDLDFQRGDQRYYMCKCKHCSTWVCPDYKTDMVLPGFSKPIMDLRAEDVDSNRYDLDKAFLKCPSCGKDLFSSLIDPERRQWVATHPDRNDHSYQVYPWDVPKYNTPPAILRQLADYPLKSDFMNFVIGLPYSDADNTFMTGEDHKRKYCDIDMWIYQNCVIKHSTVGGMDIGKICHFLVMVPVHGGYHVVWMEKIENSKNSPAAPEVIKRYDFYNMSRLCIDAGPDISLVNTLLSAREGIISVVYVNNIAGPVPLTEKASGDQINADRTKTLTLTLTMHNSGEFHYPHRDDVKNELFDHLDTTKKLRQKTSTGDMEERFIKTGKADHWVHALNYANIAALSKRLLVVETPPMAVPSVGRVKLGSGVQHKSVKDQDESTDSLVGLFRVRSGRRR